MSLELRRRPSDGRRRRCRLRLLAEHAPRRLRRADEVSEARGPELVSRSRTRSATAGRRAARARLVGYARRSMPEEGGRASTSTCDPLEPGRRLAALVDGRRGAARREASAPPALRGFVQGGRGRLDGALRGGAAGARCSHFVPRCASSSTDDRPEPSWPDGLSLADLPARRGATASTRPTMEAFADHWDLRRRRSRGAGGTTRVDHARLRPVALVLVGRR